MPEDRVKPNVLTIPSSSLADITATTISAFITSGLDEGFSVELKDHQEQDPNFKYNVRRTIASLANREGGYLLVGIKDKKNSSDPLSVVERIAGFSTKGEVSVWVDEVCSKDLVQPTPSYEVGTISVAKKKVLVIKVYGSLVGPVGIKRDSSSLLEFWVRGNGSNMKMDYMMLNDKFNQSQLSHIKSAFFDLWHIAVESKRIGKMPLATSYNPVHLSSVIMDNKQLFYSIFSDHLSLVGGLNDLSALVYALNDVVRLINSKHGDSVQIGNADELQGQITELTNAIHKKVTEVIVELVQTYPEIVGSQMKKMFKQLGINEEELNL